jgi:uncharacterized membrane protein YfcA
MSSILHVYLPIAGNSVNLLSIVGLGGVVGLLSGIFGVGGGFLMTPLLIMMGIPPTVAAASDSNQIVGASTSGTLAHFRLGNVDIRMGLLLLAGGVAGGTAGVQVIKVLRQLGNADFFISLTYVLMLGLIGGYMFLESLQSMRTAKRSDSKRESRYGRFVAGLPWQMNFPRSGIRLSLLMPLALGSLVGVLAAIMGVGGGFIMVPIMVYLLRMPMHVVVGTSLFQILFTCIDVTIMQSAQNHTVDFVLALLLLVGSSVGAQVGAKLGRKLHGDHLKILLASLVLAVMGKMLFDLLAQPAVRLAYMGGH